MAAQVESKMTYAVVFHLDTGLMCLDGVYDDYEAAYGRALLSLQNYADDHTEEYAPEDLYFSTIYELEGGDNFGMSLMLRGNTTNQLELGMDKELADVWVLTNVTA